MILRGGAGGDTIHGRRVAETLILRDQRRGRHVRHHKARVKPAVLHQKRRQLRVGRVTEPLHPPLRHRGQLRHADRQEVESLGWVLAVEVPGRYELAPVRQHERVVRGRVELRGQPGAAQSDRVVGGAVNLWAAAESV